ncbi:MAG: putative type secretion system protein [Verrucomicrobiales bacterium]|nr:putative type secretion system protein [Verrucomicrobiales bacterium]
MKHPNKSLIIISIFASTLLLRADDQPAPATLADAPKAEVAPAKPVAAKPAPERKPAQPPQLAVTGEMDRGLRFNFRGVPLETVLNYLSDAAGFIIVPEADLKGKVDIISTQPLNKQEAVDLLNTIVSKNGLAAMRNGRTLTIITQDEAKKRDIPVMSGSEPDDIPKTDNIVTQILPMHTLNASQLAKDLSSLIPQSAILTANEAGNALVMTGTQTQIHRVAEIIKALDSSSISSIRVFALQYADAKTLAAVIKDVFASPAESSKDAVRNYFRMRFGGGDEGGDSSDRHSSKHGSSSGGGGGGSSKVTAVADDYSNSVIVSAPEDLMTTIEKVVKEVDQPVEDVSSVRVFRLKFADAGEMAELLNNLFGDENKTDDNNRPRFSFFTPPQPNSSASAGESARSKKQARVSAVADRRTGSVVVTASKVMIEQIAKMIQDLDSNPARKQKVYVYSLENADVQQVEGVLHDLFQTTTTSSQRSTQQQNSDALTQRQTSAAQQTTTGSTFSIGSGNNSALRGQ